MRLFLRALSFIYLGDNVGGNGGGCALEAETGDRESNVSVLGSPGSLQSVVKDLDIDIDKGRKLSSQNVLEGIQRVGIGVRAFDGGDLNHGTELGLFGSKSGSLSGDGLLGVLESLVDTLDSELALLALVHAGHPGGELFQILEVGEEGVALGVGGDGTPDGIVGEEGLVLDEQEGGRGRVGGGGEGGDVLRSGDSLADDIEEVVLCSDEGQVGFGVKRVGGEGADEIAGDGDLARDLDWLCGALRDQAGGGGRLCGDGLKEDGGLGSAEGGGNGDEAIGGVVQRERQCHGVREGGCD